MILSAGLGTRLMPLTKDCPKPMVPVLGVPLLRYTLEQLILVGVRSATLNTHYLPVQFREGLHAIESQLKPGALSIRVSSEADRLLGSLGGIVHAMHSGALPVVDSEPFFLTNADMIHTLDFRALEATHQKFNESRVTDLTLGLLPCAPQGSKEAYREVKFDSSTSQMTGLGALATDRPFYTGIAVIEPRCLRQFPDHTPLELVKDLILPLAAQGRVGVHLFDSQNLWMDIGSPDLWAHAQNTLLQSLGQQYWFSALVRKYNAF